MLNQFYTNQIKNLSAELLLLKEQYNKLVNLNEEEASAREYNPRTFDTILAPHEEEMFSKFAETANLKNESMLNHFDLRAFYLDNVTPEVNGTEIAFSIEPKFKRRDGSLILPGTYKKPSHPTFSQESMYHGATNHEGIWQLGGRWLQVGRYADNVFIAHPTQIDTPEKESALLSHFREVEPNHVLVHPVSMEVLHHPIFANVKEREESMDDYARRRIERLKGLQRSTGNVLAPIEFDSPELQDLMQRMYGTRGGGAVGGGRVIPPATTTYKAAIRVSDLMDETGGLTQDEIEKIASSGVFERQSKSGHFPVGRGGGSIKLTLPKNPSIKQVPRYEVTTGGSRIFTTDLSNMITFSGIGDNPIRAGEADFETIYGLEGADDSVRHKGSSASYNYILGDPAGIFKALYPGPKENRRRAEELWYQPLLTRRVVRSIDDLNKDYENALRQIDAHIEKHAITPEEIDAVEKADHEEIKQEVRDLYRTTTTGSLTKSGKIRIQYSPEYKRKRILRDLKSKFVLADRLKSSIENYDPSAQSEPEYDIDERLYAARKKSGEWPAVQYLPRGELGVGREWPPSPDLKARMGGAAGYGDQQIVALRAARGEMYKEAEQRRRDEVLAPEREAIKQARLAKIEKDLAYLKIQSQIEAGREIERQNAKRERTDLSSLNLTAQELRDLADRPYEDAREIETGLSAKEIRRIGPSRKKKSSSYVRKALRAEREAEAQLAMERGAEEAKVLDKRKAQERADLESMLSRDFPDLERERYSAVTPEKVSGPGADLARDLAFRASARRKGVPLADRPEFIRYLGEAVLNISRARTIS